MQLDAPAAEPPTDPVALIAYLDDERTVENTEIDELRSAADESQHPYDYQALEDAVAQSAEREFRRYKMLADAVQDAARPAPRPITVQDLRNAWTNDQYLPDTEREALQALPDRDVREALPNNPQAP